MADNGEVERLRDEHRRIDVIPFASERGWMATLDASPEGAELHVKGSVETILARCTTMLVEGASAPIDRDRTIASSTSAPSRARARSSTDPWTSCSNPRTARGPTRGCASTSIA